APDLLTEAVQIGQLVGADRDRVEPLEQAELFQFLDRVRQRIDADAELADGVGLLINLALDAARMQHQRGDEPAHTSADDDGLHALDTGRYAARHFCPRARRNQSPGSHTVSGLYRAASGGLNASKDKGGKGDGAAVNA